MSLAARSIISRSAALASALVLPYWATRRRPCGRSLQAFRQQPLREAPQRVDRDPAEPADLDRLEFAAADQVVDLAPADLEALGGFLRRQQRPFHHRLPPCALRSPRSRSCASKRGGPDRRSGERRSDA